VRQWHITFRSCRRGAQQAPCFTGARVASVGGNSLCYMEWAAHKLDAARHRAVSCLPRVGANPDFFSENEGRGWAGDDARRP